MLRLLAAVDDKASFIEIICKEGTDTSKLDSRQPISIISYKYQGSSGKYDRIAQMEVVGDHLIVLRNNYILQVFKILNSSTIKGLNYYKLIRTIPLNPLNNIKDGEKCYETKFVGLAIHFDKICWCVTELGEGYFLHLEDLISDDDEEEEESDEEIKKVENEYNEYKQKLVEKYIAEKKLKKEEVLEENIKLNKPIKISKKVSTNIEFDESIPILSINLDKKNVSGFNQSFKNFGIFGYGGNENDVKLINLAKEFETFLKEKKSKDITDNEKLVIFFGKNVNHDKIGLRVPIHITNFHFIKEKELKNLKKITIDNIKEYKFEFITSTRYGQLRRYNTQHGRKPIENQIVFAPPFNAPNKKPGILTCKLLGNDDQVIVSDDHNSIIKYDFLSKKSLGKYLGNSGAVFSADILNNEDLILGGLDKYVRVYDVESRELKAQVFVKSRISCVKVLKEEDSKNNKRELEEDDEEEIWDQLEGNKKVKV